MPACEIRPKDKRAFTSAVGQEPVRRHGKRKYYKPADVSSAADALRFCDGCPLQGILHLYESGRFKALHDAAGEVCDYAAMKAELLTDLAGGGSFSWLDIYLSWLEWPDIELPSIFDWSDFSL